MDEHDTRTDDDTERLAGELYSRVRELNRCVQEGPGLTRPATAYTVLGNLAQSSFSLAQTAEQLDMFLDRELSAGRLGHDHGELVPAAVRAHDALARASEHATEVGEAFRRAQGALAPIHSTVDNEVQSPEKAEEADTTVADHLGGATRDLDPAERDFPAPIGEVLAEGSQPERSSAPRPSTPRPPRPAP
ncbi:hypothetical protein [Actinomadura sp. WMMB 499]|uniref:hypothetical protein n=1 Tax=Actinomadura sp. WMMB 499 TaxID=1219491 RepID=UPI0012478C55|nr:hypothetical protein [Actinomadura sp. WMMB 499]QFG22896.1 hypothetical protein F7P10_19025 [Actinomadura sp. WMMB 499]